MAKFIELAAQGVQGLQAYQPGKPIEELERELGITDIIKLASNENPLPTSERVKQAIAASIADIARYPDGSAFELKQKLAQKLHVAENQITIGNGSSEVLELTTRVFLGAGQSAVVSQHAFLVYRLYIQSLSANAIVVPAKNWGHDISAMIAAVDSTTRVVFIANPNNPTGTWVSLAEIESLLQRISKDVIVLLDEAYYEYVEKDGYGSGISLIEKYPNLVVTRTFSKAYGLAALRVGYAVSSPEIADLLNRLRPPFNVTTLGLCAAAAVLDDEQFIETSCQVNRDGMVQLEQGLAALGLNYIPSVGNFIAIEMPGSVNEIYQALLHKGVITRPIGVYEMPNHLRVTIGTEKENKKFLTALSEVLAI